MLINSGNKIWTTYFSLTLVPSTRTVQKNGRTIAGGSLLFLYCSASLYRGRWLVEHLRVNGGLPKAIVALYVSSKAIDLPVTLFVAGLGWDLCVSRPCLDMLNLMLLVMIKHWHSSLCLRILGRQPVYISCGFFYIIINMQRALSRTLPHSLQVGRSLIWLLLHP